MQGLGKPNPDQVKTRKDAARVAALAAAEVYSRAWNHLDMPAPLRSVMAQAIYKALEQFDSNTGNTLYAEPLE